MKSIELDYSKRCGEEPEKGHNRWHPDIPMAATVKPGDDFILECYDWTGGQIKNDDCADDVRDVDLTQVHFLTGPVGVEGAEPGGLLAEISGQVPVEREHGERDIFLHHADDAVLDHAHQRHMRGQTRRLELVDAGPDGEDDFQIPVAGEIGRKRPGDEVAHVVRIDIGRVRRKDDVGHVRREGGFEDGRALRRRVEQEDGRAGHARNLSPSERIMARQAPSSPRVIYSSGRWARAMSPGPQMTSTNYFMRHNATVEAQRQSAGAAPGTLISGHKKDVVLTTRLASNRGRVAIYGWHQRNGQPIQPLSTVHGAGYADYSHGVRLVSRTAFLNGQSVDLRTLMADPRYAGLLSSEGPISGPGLRMAALASN